MATAPESSSETPAGMHITDDTFEEGQPSDENSDETSSSTGTTVPNMSLVKYSASTNKPFPRPPTLMTCRNRDSTVPTDLCQRPGPSLALTRSCATRPPAIDTMIWALLVSWLFSRLSDRTLAPPPSTLPSFSQPRRLVSGTVETQHPPQILGLTLPPDPSPNVSHHGSHPVSLFLFRDPRCSLGPSPMFSGSWPATSLFSLEAAFRVLLVHRLVSFFSDGTPDSLPATLSLSSRSHQLALGIIETSSPSIETRQLPSDSRPPALGSLVVVTGRYRFLWIFGCYPNITRVPSGPRRSPTITSKPARNPRFSPALAVVTLW